MNPDLLVLYEDSGWRRLWPLSATRPMWALRLGGRCLWEKQRDAFRPERIAVDLGAVISDVEARSPVIRAFAEAANVWSSPEPAPAQSTVLWWNGAATPPVGELPPLPDGAAGIRYLGGPRRVAGICHAAGAGKLEELRLLLFAESRLPEGWAEVPVEVTWVSELWDLCKHLPGELERDAAAVAAATGAEAYAGGGGVHALGERVYVARGARLDPGTVLDARGGPVVIAEGAVVESLSHVVGPAWVGPGSHVLGGKLAGVALGPQCRVGGEVEQTVFQGYSNKRHQGFLGHAAVGEWVNLGAMTANSDLKNNYGPVRVWVNGIETDSGESKVGCFLGDHVKTGIGTLLTTGAVVGPGSNLFAGGRFTPRYLPGWAWWDGDATVPHRWDKFLATARTAMGRRDLALTPAHEAALQAAWRRGPKAL